jgi:hypothetical protein
MQKKISSIFREEPYSDYEIEKLFQNIKADSPVIQMNAKSSLVKVNDLIVFSD